MDNNNYGNKPSFGNTPFNERNTNRTPPRSSFGNSSYRPMSSYGSGYPRPSSFSSSYRRPMGGSSYGASRSLGYSGMGASVFNRPSYGSFSSGSRSIGYGGMRAAPGGFNRPPYGASSPYASRFAPIDSSRYGYGRTLPPYSMPKQIQEPQEPVWNKYSLENAQPQGVDVHNNFQQAAPTQDQAPVYQEPVAEYQDPNAQYQEPVAQEAQYEQPVEQPVEQHQQPVASPGVELSAEFLKSWEPSIMALAEYSSVGSEQRGAYIVDDNGNLIAEGFEGKQEDPNNPDVELFDYAAEINAINSAYSNGRDGELYQANLLVSNLPSEETASYVAQIGIKAIYYWVKGEKEFRKYQKNKNYKKVMAILEPLNCKLIPVQGEK